MRDLSAATVLALVACVPGLAQDEPAPEEMAAAIAAGTLDAASVDVAVRRADRPEDLRRLSEALLALQTDISACYVEGPCELGQRSRWAIAAPDAATFAADMARLDERLNAIEDDIDGLDALAQAAGQDDPERPWIKLSRLSREAADPIVAELFARDARDQFIRWTTFEVLENPTLSDDDRRRLSQSLGPLMIRLDRDNRVWLIEKARERGWFTMVRDGRDAAVAAWQFIRHSQGDPEWQTEIFGVIEPLGDAPEFKTEPHGFQYAFLADRVAQHAGAPQPYGTQGECRDGAWEPHPIAEPVADLDARLAARGAQPYSAWLTRMNKSCEPG